MNTEEFLETYNQYLGTYNRDLFPALQDLLRKVEKEVINNDGRPRSEIVFPEKGLAQVVGWQVMRNTEFTFIPRGSHQATRFTLCVGEMILWQTQWDRDVLVSRYPCVKYVSGQIVRIGYNWKDHFDEEAYNYSKLSTEENDKLFETGGPVDESGLYLPIY